MKQVLLAIVLILAPVAAFTGFHVYPENNSGTTGGLGDLSSFKTIIGDVQAITKKGDLTAAARRITDYESAWDEGEAAIRPLNPIYWGNIDHASDTALKALRESSPSVDKVQKSLLALMAVLNNPAQPAD